MTNVSLHSLDGTDIGTLLDAAGPALPDDVMLMPHFQNVYCKAVMHTTSVKVVRAMPLKPEVHSVDFGLEKWSILNRSPL